MDFTPEELALVAKHREKQAKAVEDAAKVAKVAEALRIAEEAHKVEAAEAARRQQSIHRTVSDLIDQAKQLLIDAKQVAKDNGLQYQIEGMVTEMINEVSEGQYWYGSDQSLC